jgi:hypothetical protein
LVGLAAILCLLAQSPPAIPDPVALLKEVEAHQSKMDEVRENYTFRQIIRTDDVDAHGKVTKTSTRENEVFFVKGRRVARLVKKDESDLSAEERTSEDRRVSKQAEEFSKSPGPPSRRGGGGIGLIRAILAVAKVSNPRRVELNGRNTLVFDFTGNPDARARDTSESAAKKLEGTVWIDEADRQVARIQIDFYDTFRLGGGLLASVQRGTHIDLQQSPIGEGLWMQTFRDQHVEARIAMLKGIRQNEQMRNVDFRKFDVGTVQRISTLPKSP